MRFDCETDNKTSVSVQKQENFTYVEFKCRGAFPAETCETEAKIRVKHLIYFAFECFPLKYFP